jgi:hypothetical protein
MNYLPVNVLRSDLGDCSNGGVSAPYGAKLVVPCSEGFLSEEDVAERGYVVLELMPPAYPSCPNRLKPRGESRWVMFGGNFVYSSDSRWSREYGAYPLPVHDRVEG